MRFLEGSGNFEINGEAEGCQKGSLVVIPSGSIFKYTGKMKLFLVTIPWWRPEQEETL
jgi:mannose-6-phosphate isomerase-like protein (cupin superfamily)